MEPKSRKPLKLLALQFWRANDFNRFAVRGSADRGGSLDFCCLHRQDIDFIVVRENTQTIDRDGYHRGSKPKLSLQGVDFVAGNFLPGSERVDYFITQYSISQNADFVAAKILAPANPGAFPILAPPSLFARASTSAARRSTPARRRSISTPLGLRKPRQLRQNPGGRSSEAG